MTPRFFLTDAQIRATADHWQRTGQTTWPRETGMTRDEAERRLTELARDYSLRVSITPWDAATQGYALLVERVGKYGVQRITRVDEGVRV